MKLVFTILKLNRNGQEEAVRQDVEGASVVLGRGGKSDILFDSRLVSLEHAKLTIEDDKLCIEDLRSLGGVFVNDSLSYRQVLQNGDSIRLGDVTLSVVLKDGTIGLVRDLRSEKKEDVSDKIVRIARRLDVANVLPSYRTIALLLILCIVVGYVVLPALEMNKIQLSTGPVTNHHRMVDAQCSSCHDIPFTKIPDDKCQACHHLSDHNPVLPSILEKSPQLSIPCIGCHLEHKGLDSLITPRSKLCINCHGDIKALNPNSKRLDVNGFNGHPQFRVTLLDPNSTDDPPKISRVSLDEKDKLIDGTHLRLNHSVHLKEGLKGKDGPVTLNCKDCHELSRDYRTLKPIQFNKHCRSCHSLGFDDRLPGNQVPHGNADEVYNYMYAEYAKLFLGNQPEQAVQAQGFTRFRPGEEATPETPKTEYVRKYVEAETRVAEQLIFTRTGCKECHEVIPKRDEGGSDSVSTGKLSKYQIVKPRVPVRWMPFSIYSHGAHEEVKCESCHGKARESKDTKDVLVPGIESCRSCHFEGQKTGTVMSECIQCHTFHNSRELALEKKRTIEDIKRAVSPEAKAVVQEAGSKSGS